MKTHDPEAISENNGNVEIAHLETVMTPEEHKKKNSDDPFLSSKRHWNDYIAANIAGQKMLIALTAVSMLVALVCAFGMVYNSTKSKYIPYVIEVDKLGQVAATSGPLNVSSFRNERVIRSTLASFIEDSRSVTPDITVQSNMIRRLFNKLNSSDPAIKTMSEYLNSDSPHNPFKRSEREMVNVDITSILQQSDTTYYVEWDEYVRERSGEEKNQLHMKALITIYIVDPLNFTEEMIRDNPGGVYIQNFSWQEIVK